jgi:peptidoglycan/LPS O-acetylase OafA/YrhL
MTPIQATYTTLAAGGNSVQILFVLSGFLMAFLYPTIQKRFGFIRKRYTRIFPVLSVVVIYFWLTLFFKEHLFGANFFLLVFIALLLFWTMQMGISLTFGEHC